MDDIINLMDTDDVTCVEDLKGVGSHLLSGICCRICYEIPLLPIKCCSNGHVFCCFCENRFKSARCQYCNTYGPLVENKALTLMVTNLDVAVKCRNRESGCKERCLPSNMTNHYKECKFRPVLCDIDDCGIDCMLVPIENMEKHVEKTHSKIPRVRDGGTGWVEIQLDTRELLQDGFSNRYIANFIDANYILIIENVELQIVIWLFSLSRDICGSKYDLVFDVNNGEFKVKHEGLYVQPVDFGSWDRVQDEGEVGVIGINSVKRCSSKGQASCKIKLIK